MKTVAGPVRRFSARNPVVFHYQSVHREYAADTELPLWLRVAELACGSMRGNGHASFGVGELAQILGKRDDLVCRAIKRAVEKGRLTGESGIRCLVVPPHAVTGGIGEPDEPCPVHAGKRVGRRISDSRPLAPHRLASDAAPDLEPPEAQQISRKCVTEFCSEPRTRGTLCADCHRLKVRDAVTA